MEEHIEEYELYLDECHNIIARMIEQAIRDYLGLEGTLEPTLQRVWLEAECFLFEPTYVVDWGGVDRSLADFLDILDIDPLWFREQIIERRAAKQK